MVVVVVVALLLLHWLSLLILSIPIPSTFCLPCVSGCAFGVLLYEFFTHSEALCQAV